MFAVFDENRSWYANENIQKYSQAPNMVNPSDPDSYNANVIYSTYSEGLQLQEERVDWPSGEFSNDFMDACLIIGFLET